MTNDRSAQLLRPHEPVDALNEAGPLHVIDKPVNEDIDPDTDDAVFRALGYRANPALEIQIPKRRASVGIIRPARYEDRSTLAPLLAWRVARRVARQVECDGETGHGPRTERIDTMVKDAGSYAANSTNHKRQWM